MELKFIIKKLKQNIVPITLFLGIFSLYLLTAAPGVTHYADSSELITASYTLGIPHPPGYPVYVLVGKLFSFIPLGSIAFRYAIMSSFFGALTVVLVYLILSKFYPKKEKIFKFQLTFSVPAMVGALSLAFSYLFWIYSIIPEVFALSNFFAASIMYIGVKWYHGKQSTNNKRQITNKQQKTKKFQSSNLSTNFKLQNWKWVIRDFRQSPDYYPFLIATLSSLGFLAHQTIVFLAPALIYLIWITDSKLFIPTKRWFKLLGGFLIGFLPSLYFPIVSYLSNPIIDFGNVKGPLEFWRLMSRYYYAQASPIGKAYLQNSLRFNERINEIPYYISILSESMTPYFLGLGLIGLIAMAVILARGKTNNIKYFVGLAYLFAGLFLAMYAVLGDKWNDIGYNLLGVHPRMYLMGGVIFSILIGMGVHTFLDIIKRSKVLSVPIFILILLLLPVYLFTQNYGDANKSNFYLGEDYAHNFFANIEQDAIFFVRGDMPSFTSFYYKNVLDLRGDITLIPLSLPLWQQKFVLEENPDLWDIDSNRLELIVRNIIKNNLGKRPIYFTGLPSDELHLFGLAENPYTLSPIGLTQKVTEEFEPQEDDVWEDMVWRNSDMAEDYRDAFAKEVLEQYIIGRFNSFSWNMRYGYYDLAKRDLDEMRKMDANNGATERALGRFAEAGGVDIRVEKRPNRTNVELQRESLVFLREGQPLGALGNYLYLVEENPQNTGYRLELAKIFAGLGWSKEAEEQFEKILEVEPDNEHTKEIKRQWERIK